MVEVKKLFGRISLYLDYKKDNYTPAKHCNELTGIEIEIIYLSEHPQQAVKEDSAVSLEDAEMYFYNNKRTFTGIISGSYLDEDVS